MVFGVLVIKGIAKNMTIYATILHDTKQGIPSASG